MKSFPLFSVGKSQWEKRESWICWTQNNLFRSLNQLSLKSRLYPHLREKDNLSADLCTWWHTRTEGKVHRCVLWSACVLAAAAVWMPSIMPWLVGSPWVCLRGAWTASSPCWLSSGSSRSRLYPKSYFGLKLLNVCVSWRWLTLVKRPQVDF